MSDLATGVTGVTDGAGIETCIDGSCSAVVSGSVQSSPAQLCFVLLDQHTCIGAGKLSLT